MPITPGLHLPLAEVELRSSRSSGPGGQHANVTASRVEAIFDVRASRTLSAEHKARIIERLGPRPAAVAQDTRSQSRNRELALERLGRRLAEAVEVKPQRKPTGPSPAERARRLAEKRRRGERKVARRRPTPEE